MSQIIQREMKRKERKKQIKQLREHADKLGEYDNKLEILGDHNSYSKTERGYHPRSGNSNDGWNIIGTMSFMNQPILDMAREIKTPVLLIHGEKAHSRYFSEGAFEAMTGVKPEPGKSNNGFYVFSILQKIHIFQL